MIKEKKRNDKAEKKALKQSGSGGGRASPVIETREIDPDAMSLSSMATTVETDGNSVRGFRSLVGNRNSKVIAALPTMYYVRPGTSPAGPSSPNRPGMARSRSRLHQTTNLSDDEEEDDDESESMMDPEPDSPRMHSRTASDASDEEDAEIDEAYAHLSLQPSEDNVRDDTSSIIAFKSSAPQDRRKSIFQTFDLQGGSQKFWQRFFSKQPATQEKEVLQMKTRFDYLDGLRGVACLCVSLIHFSLTFYF